MSETRIEKARNKLARVYGVGIVVFTVIVGLVTLLASFLANLRVT